MITMTAFLAWYFLSASPVADVKQDNILYENFDAAIPGTFGLAVLQHRYVELDKTHGTANSAAAKVRYQGDERGSKRIVVNSAFEPQQAATLAFSVQFCPDFDFAKGGKLHGLGSKKPVAGGHAVTDPRWSARLMWRREGGLMTYVYHQDMKGKYGDTEVAQDFVFEAGRYYQVEMTITLNSPGHADGSVEVSVDGEKRINHQKLRFRKDDDPAGLVQTLMFNTFHGGSSAEWAPKTADGAFKTDCAFFDNFSVKPVMSAVTQ